MYLICSLLVAQKRRPMVNKVGPPSARYLLGKLHVVLFFFFFESNSDFFIYMKSNFKVKRHLVLAGTVEQITCLHEWYHSIPSPMSASKELAFVEQRNPPSVSYYCLWEHFAWEDWESDFQFLSNFIINITRTYDHGQDVDASRL